MGALRGAGQRRRRAWPRDNVLTIFAGILGQACPGSYLAGRHDGDELSLLRPGIDAGSVGAFAKRVELAVRGCSNLGDADVRVNAGVANWVRKDESDDVLKRARLALCCRKRGGGSTFNR